MPRFKSGSVALFAAIIAQLFFAVVFLGFFIVDVSALWTRPIGYTIRELVEISAVVALLLGIAINTWVVRRAMQRATLAEESLLIARGAFKDLAEREFDRWMLSRAERDVAMLAIKGFTNLEIA